MRRGFLSDLFTGVVSKRLTLVETVTPFSRQHEFQGIKTFRKLFGDEDQRQIPTRFVLLSEEQEGVSVDGFVSWSNVRKGKPRAPEYHLYYSGNVVTEVMRPGDVMFLARRPDGHILVVIVPGEGTFDAQIRWLFGLDEEPGDQAQFREVSRDHAPKLDFAARYILNELGIEVEEQETDLLDRILEPLGGKFPTTSKFSELARSSLPDVDTGESADAALVMWLEREEALFKRLERLQISERLRIGFGDKDNIDVEGFLAYSLTIQNRRKSRAGFSLENHLEWIFRSKKLRFDRGAVTEGKSKPDFLFPGASEYRNPSFPCHQLTMLGSKSTLKDRWRQVLAEADRIDNKHLLTLEPAISEPQTDEMRAKKLQLVMPKSLHATFRPAQQAWLMSLDAFIALIEERQNALLPPS
jgi:hypothetical protein